MSLSITLLSPVNDYHYQTLNLYFPRQCSNVICTGYINEYVLHVANLSWAWLDMIHCCPYRGWMLLSSIVNILHTSTAELATPDTAKKLTETVKHWHVL